MTATPESDVGVCDAGSLLRDIGRSGSLTAGTGSAEAELMRAAHDPLLVRRLLQEREVHGDARGMTAARYKTILIPLTDCAFRKVAGPHHGSGAATCRYEAPSGRLEPSLNPIVFTPDPEDRSAALDLDPAARVAGPNMGFATRLIWLGLGVGGVLVLGLSLFRG